MLGALSIAVLVLSQGDGTPTASRPPTARPSASPAIPPPPVGITYRGFAFDPTVARDPTASRAASRTWFAEGRWWAGLIAPSTDRLTIFRLDRETQRWVDTGTLLDDRAGVIPDVLWAGERLYVVSAGDREDSERDAIRLRVYRYDATEDRFAPETDFPVTIHATGTSAATIARDATGRSWVAWTSAGRVWIAHTLGHDARWSAPFELPVEGNAVTVDDVAAIASFGPGRVGVMWTDQGTGRASFAWHADEDPPTTWSTPETVVPELGIAGDRIDLKSFPSGSGTGLVAALTSTADRGDDVNSLDPLALLAVRQDDAAWSTHLVGQVRDHHSAPVVLVDASSRSFLVAATLSTGGGSIVYKRSPIDTIAFETGDGVTLISSPEDPRVRDVAVTKDPVDAETGLLVLASDRSTGRYLHGIADLGGGLPDADPADPSRLADPAPPEPATPVTLVSNDFEAWPAGPASATDWTVRADDPPDSLSLVDDGDGRVLRLQPDRAGAAPRACRAFPETATGRISVTARVRFSVAGAADTSLLQVRGSGGEAGTIRVTDAGVLAWFDGTTKVRSATPLVPGRWYRVRAVVDPGRRTFDFEITTDGGERVRQQTGLSWRSAGLRALRTVCLEAAAATPRQDLDLDSIAVVALPD